MQSSQSRKHLPLLISGAVIILVAGIVALLMYAGSSQATDHKPGGVDAQTAFARDIFSDTFGYSGPEDDSIPVTDIEDLLDPISVDRPIICAGETIHAKVQPSNPELDLRYSIGGQPGKEAVLQFDEPGEYTITAIGRKGATGIDYKRISIRVLPPNDENCAGRSFLQLSALPSKAEDGAVDFQVSLGSQKAMLHDLAWEFGDGSGANTGSTPHVRHNYSARPQDSYTSTFVVTVRGRDAAGRTLEARTTVGFLNTLYYARLSDHRQMPVNFDRFPQAKGGSYESTADFTNIEKNDVYMKEAEVHIYDCALERPPRIVKVPVSQVLDDMAFASGVRGERRVRIPASMIREDECQAGLALTGHDTEGNTVNALLNFELRVPPEVTAESGRYGKVRIEDPQLQARVAHASKLLGRDVIGGEDLERLERQGAFEEIDRQVAERLAQEQAQAETKK